MKSFSLRTIQVGLFVALLCLLVISILVLRIGDRVNPMQTGLLDESAIPAKGWAENDTDGEVPGDPNNGVRSLKNLYRLYETYRRQKGAMPVTAAQLIDDVITHPSEYGLQSASDIKSLLGNPDNKYSDIGFQRADPMAASFLSEGLRPDGQPLFGPKSSGTRDVLAVSVTYFHENLRTFKGKKTTVNPVGFYQVLWENGEVTRVPYDKALYVISKQGSRSAEVTKAFPGQAGIPSGALSYEKYWTDRAGWRQAPRGSAGGGGIAFDSTTSVGN